MIYFALDGDTYIYHEHHRPTSTKFASHPHPFFTNMIIVSNDPIWWPAINSYRVSSYSVVASFVVELVWRQRWSLMSVLYLGVCGLAVTVVMLEADHQRDSSGWITFVVWNWTTVLVFAMLCVIMITRLHAMYQGSRKILIFLIVIFLIADIFGGVVAVMTMMHTSWEEFILFGTYQCWIDYGEDIIFLNSITWILGSVWEVLALCVAVWTAIKHFRDLRQYSAGGIIRDCYTVLMKTHVIYFASFVAVSCFNLIVSLSPTSSVVQSPLENQIYTGFLRILTVVQSFVLGPRLILGVREYHAKLVAGSDAAPGMTSIAFQERVHISTGSGV
ncbi:hypothetical protein BDR03DRAFT_963779 [Suillus americanus]|nr:hypothetical protein BDR03DRAFT_963779 [Suillus americanus]